MKGFLAALLLSAPVFANATTWTDTYDAGPNGFLFPEVVTTGETVSWTHNIADADSGFFTPGVDNVNNFSITLFLSDDSIFDGSEKEQLKIDGVNIGSQYNVPTLGTVVYNNNLTLNWLAALNDDGALSLSLKSTEGDFWFFGSFLEANGSKNSTSVPEPSSLALLAAGMLGIVAMRRMTSRAS